MDKKIEISDEELLLKADDLFSKQHEIASDEIQEIERILRERAIEVQMPFCLRATRLRTILDSRSNEVLSRKFDPPMNSNNGQGRQPFGISSAVAAEKRMQKGTKLHITSGLMLGIKPEEMTTEWESLLGRLQTIFLPSSVGTVSRCNNIRAQIEALASNGGDELRYLWISDIKGKQGIIDFGKIKESHQKGVQIPIISEGQIINDLQKNLDKILFIIARKVSSLMS